MNNQRRTKLMQAFKKLREVEEIVRNCQHQEEEYWEGLSEKAKESDKGETSEQVQEYMATICECIGDALEGFSEIQENV